MQQLSIFTQAATPEPVTDLLPTPANNLPPGWVWTTIGEMTDAVNPGFPSGEHNKSGKGVRHLRPMNVSSNGTIDLIDTKYVLDNGRDRLRKNDVLFNNTNSPALVGKTAWVQHDTDWLYSNHMTRIRFPSQQMHAGFTAYYLHHLFLAGFFRMNCTNHVNQASIGTGFLTTKVPVPLPPLAEQARIVAAIEEQFTRLDAGVAALKSAQVKLKRYRAAVLKAACEGRLVPQDPTDEPAPALLARILTERRAKWEADLRARGKDPANARYDNPAAPDTDNLPTLPEGWGWATWEQLSSRVTVGYVGPMVNEYREEGVPFLRSQNVRENRFDLEGLKYVSRDFHNKLAKSALHPGDIVIVRSGSVGVTCVIPGFLSEANCSDLVIVQGPTGVVPEYGSYYMNSAAKHLVRAGQVGIALTHFNTQSVAILPIAAPPLAEQARIVAEVERRLSVARAAEDTLSASLRRAARLRQAILARAFAGKLVPQDPDDEPAAALLERIRADRLSTASRPARHASKRSIS